MNFSSGSSVRSLKPSSTRPEVGGAPELRVVVLPPGVRPSEAAPRAGVFVTEILRFRAMASGAFDWFPGWRRADSRVFGRPGVGLTLAARVARRRPRTGGVT
jgi:hypothetical protein